MEKGVFGAATFKRLRVFSDKVKKRVVYFGLFEFSLHS